MHFYVASIGMKNSFYKNIRIELTLIQNTISLQVIVILELSLRWQRTKCDCEISNHWNCKQTLEQIQQQR